MLILPFRAILLYLLVMIAIRLMGKHQVGQLQPFELVITIMISELAAIPMQDSEIPLLNGIIPIATLLFIQTSLSLISLKSTRARQIICGNASILIANGHINTAEMARIRYSLTDLLEQLRLKDIANIADVEFAILETSGKLSVIPKSQKRPVQPEDLHLETAYEGLPLTLILDGKIQRQNLQKNRLSEEWLRTQLHSFGFNSCEEVLLASQDTSGKLYIQPKKSYKESKIL
jgi:uncharacterized membrane protein YcaP (DUF421 family)